MARKHSGEGLIMDKFWRCYIEETGKSYFQPSAKHSTLESAKEEAERLAKLNRQKVSVLEVAWSCEPQETSIKWVESPKVEAES